eukprot:scaffold2.g7210.t1
MQPRPARPVAAAAAAPPATAAATSSSAAEQETLKAYLRTQNGSDVRGVALDRMMFFIGAAFADWLAARLGRRATDLRVSLGHDPRLSSPLLDAAVTAGLASRGAAVARMGLCSTPAMFVSCFLDGYQYDGAVMLTASHLPVNRNGAKFCTAEGGLEKPDITALLQRAAQLSTEAGLKPSDDLDGTAHVISAALLTPTDRISSLDFLPAYSAFLRDIIKRGINHPSNYDRPLEGFKIVVNPGSGGGAFIATQARRQLRVLAPLGADVSGSIHMEPDGSFPYHVPNPEDKEAVLTTQQEAVLKTGADLGIMLDTDVDRSGVVDRHGTGMNRNRYIALMAAITLRENPGETIVTDSCTSNGLAKFIQQLGGRHFRFMKGYRNIIRKGIELNNAGIPVPLMMETSGHGAMRENYFLDDGAYVALKIVIEMVRRRLEGQTDIHELLKDLQEAEEAMEIRVAIKAPDVRAEGERVTAAFREWVLAGAGGAMHWRLEDENYEGWRVRVAEEGGKEGWLLVRPSLHDPDIVCNVESEQAGGIKAILSHLLEFFRAHPDFQTCTAKVEDYVYS